MPDYTIEGYEFPIDRNHIVAYGVFTVTMPRGFMGAPRATPRNFRFRMNVPIPESVPDSLLPNYIRNVLDPNIRDLEYMIRYNSERFHFAVID